MRWPTWVALIGGISLGIAIVGVVQPADPACVAKGAYGNYCGLHSLSVAVPLAGLGILLLVAAAIGAVLSRRTAEVAEASDESPRTD